MFNLIKNIKLYCSIANTPSYNHLSENLKFFRSRIVKYHLIPEWIRNVLKIDIGGLRLPSRANKIDEIPFTKFRTEGEPTESVTETVQ